MQPQVQSLEEILASLEPAYATSRNLYNTQLTALPGQRQTAVAALDTAKGNSFRDINTGANSKGMAFSGIPIAEQSRYLGEKYLPAVAGVESDIAKQQFTLQQAIASLESDKYKSGLDRRDKQQSVLDQYLENERNRQAQMQMASMKSSGGGGSGSMSASELKQALSSHVQGQIQAGLGGDGRVGNKTWAGALNDWTGNGGSVREFWQKWGRFVNPKFKNSYAGYNQR